MNTKLDPEQLRFTNELLKARGCKPKPRRNTKAWAGYKPLQGEKFLRGPIPLFWLLQVFLLPGKALHVANVLWHRAYLERKDSVRFNQSRWPGLSRDAARRGLAALERAGLVRVQRNPGSAPIVTFILNNKTLGRSSSSGVKK
jgi:hypothetical protein